MPPLPLRLDPETATRRPVKVWDSDLEAGVVAGEASKWFSRFLGAEVTLVHMDAATRRNRNTTQLERAFQVSFADGYPYLATTTDSLRDLNQRLEDPVPMSRFRPNLVISGGAPYDEDSWHVLRIGHLRFRMTKPCSRCMVTTIEQGTGLKTEEPLRTLSRYRKQGNSVHFGINLILEEKGTLQVGDRVEVLERRTEYA